MYCEPLNGAMGLDQWEQGVFLHHSVDQSRFQPAAAACDSGGGGDAGGGDGGGTERNQFCLLTLSYCWIEITDCC